MKVVILAGGYGTRLGFLTEAIPKPMLKIGNKPLIWHLMQYYASFGHKDFVLSLGYKAEVVKQFFYNYRSQISDFTVNLENGKFVTHGPRAHEDWNITLVDTGVDALKGARIKRIESYLDDVNFLTYGDGLADVDIQALLKFHRAHGKILTITGVHPPARFGNIIEQDGRVVSFEEKKQASEGLVNGGFMVFNKELLKYLRPDEDQDQGFEAFYNLVNDGELMVYKHEGNWECVDTERDLVHLERIWKSGNAFWA